MVDKSSKIQECIIQKSWEFDQYNENLLLTLALKEYFRLNHDFIHLSDIEPKLKSNDDGNATPDLALITSDEKKGILLEIKSTLTSHKLGAKQQIKKAEKYCKDYLNWDTQKGTVDDHSVWFVTNASNSRFVQELIEEMIREGELNFTKPFLLIEHFRTYSREAGKPTTSKYFFRKVWGRHNIPKLESELTNGFGIEEDAIILSYETCKFLRSKPPIQYTMQILFSDVLNQYYNIDEKVSYVAIDDIYELVNTFYNDCGIERSNKKTTIKRRWIREALEMFCDIHMGKRIKNTLESHNYKIRMFKPGQSINFLQYIYRRICVFELRKGIFRKRKEGLSQFL